MSVVSSLASPPAPSVHQAASAADPLLPTAVLRSDDTLRPHAVDIEAPALQQSAGPAEGSSASGVGRLVDLRVLIALASLTMALCFSGAVLLLLSS